MTSILCHLIATSALGYGYQHCCHFLFLDEKWEGLRYKIRSPLGSFPLTAPPSKALPRHKQSQTTTTKTVRSKLIVNEESQRARGLVPSGSR